MDHTDLDFTKRILTRADQIIALPPKATEILMLIVAHAWVLLEDELLKEVWPDTFVEEPNLTQNVFTLRCAGRGT